MMIAAAESSGSRALSSPVVGSASALRPIGGNGPLWIYVALYFSHWVGIGVSSILIPTIFLIACGRKALTGFISRQTVLLFGFLAFYAALVLLIQQPTLKELAEWSPGGTPRLLLQALSPLVVLALVTLMKPLTIQQFDRFVRISFYICAGTILIEWILINPLQVPSSLMPAYRDSPTYYEAFESFYRPFGLTGNASVNGSLLAVVTWVLIFVCKPRYPGRFLVAVGVILFLNNSGQALLAYFILVLYYVFTARKGIGRLLLLVASLAGVMYTVRSGIISKVSLEYILEFARYGGFQSVGAMDWMSRVFGGYGAYAYIFSDVDFTTEFYPVYAVSRFGILLLVATWGYIYARLPGERRVAFFLFLALSSIHYPTILFVELQVFLAVYIVTYSKAAVRVASREPLVLSGAVAT